jgi:tetratricopeptide (TPR) repeat protein
MKRYLFFLFTLFPLFIYGQTLQSTEDKSKASVYSNSDEKTTKAAVVIECYKSLEFVFRSAIGGKLDPFSVEEFGNKKIYTIEVERSSDYLEDDLIILNQRYAPLSIPLRELMKKQKIHFYVEDPDDPEGKSCYVKNKNQGDKSFEAASYEKAKEEYRLALACWDAPKDSYINNRIMVIDSITYFKLIAEAAFNLQEYRRSAEAYLNAYYLNINDQYLEEKKGEASLKFVEFCRDCYNTAEAYYNERDYVNAENYYKKMLRQSCPGLLEAQERVRQIEIKQTQNYHALTYEYATGVGIGISSGNYKEHHKSSGYFTLRLDPNVFEMIRASEEEVKKTEMNVSFGWTLEIYKPVWLFFGPGYTGLGQYVRDVDSKETDKPKLTLHHAVSPEIGLLGKIPILGKDRIVLRYTFQYRYAFKKEDDDLIGKTRHVFGIGICF